MVRDHQPDTREGQAGLCRESERPIVPRKPGNAGGGKGPWFRVNVRSGESREIGMRLETPSKVRKLQETLHAKAKRAPDYRFYLLHDKVYREDVLAFAYRCCKANGGSAGVDGQSFEDIETCGLERWLDALTEELRNKSYRPQAVRRVWIPKPDGTKRPLGIPTVKDRVVQTAVALVLGPIFEADLPQEQYAYRTGRSALDAVKQVVTLLDSGHKNVVDADLSGYFDCIPHAELMKSVARRLSDRHMLHLITMWLKAPVEEIDDRGRRRRTTHNKDEGCGVPQGAPISPLLSNLYMRRFVLGWKRLGHERRLDARIVNYADDLVICCRGSAEDALDAMQVIMRKLKLTVNRSKTRVCCAPSEPFDFLGYTIGRYHSSKTGNAFNGACPSRKRIRRLCHAISNMTGRGSVLVDVPTRITQLNRLLVGWANYFSLRLGPLSKVYRSIDAHARHRLRQWLCRKHKMRGPGSSRFPDAYLHETLGLVRLQPCSTTASCANA